MADHARGQSNYNAGLIASEMEATGYATIENFVPAGDLARMQAFVGDAVGRSGGEYVAFSGPAQLAGSGLETLGAAPSFRALMEEIYEVGTGKPAPRQEFYEVLRCLTGAGSLKNSYLFHYDSYVITALVPIVVPDTGLPGDLLMLPNTRRVRSRYAFNVLDKLLLDNPLTQRALKWLTLRGRLPVTRIKMVPGTMYFFWGYRSIHTNEPCDANKVRSTALFHYGNPHRDPVRAAAPRPATRALGEGVASAGH